MPHTPGPWQIGGGCLRPHHERSIVRGPNREYIARVAGGIPENDYDNRFLIVAAPELLEALKRLYALTGERHPSDAPTAWEQARIAIAKAEGR